MNILTRFKIGSRLMLGFASVLALTLIVGLFSINRIGKVNEATADLATNWMAATRSLADYSGAINVMRRAESLHLMASSEAEFTEQEKRVAEAKVQADKAWKRYEATVSTDDERILAAEIRSAELAYFAVQSRMLPLSRATNGADEKLKKMYTGESRDAFVKLAKAVLEDADFQAKGADAAYAESQANYASTRTLVIVLLVAAVALGAVLAWLITRSITGPIRQAVKVAETVAAGDLSSEVKSDSHDETGQLLAALRKMNDNLVSIVGQVRNSSDSIATGSTQIATGNADLSQRTEEQASNLQQTAASMEQLTATVTQNTDTARQAAQLAGSASSAAAEGGAVVARVVSTMGEISDSSRKIGDIIGVIDGIAFQTNILALNAAVEAARAGEQGRGFAVVAGEVRSLAQRAANAAKEIKVLIGESVEKVENGSRLVHDAGRSMNEIVSQVKRVNDLISEISAASVEQSTGIGQIGDAVNQLDQVTQQNAALVEESAAAAESLRHQAATLAQTMSVFKLGAQAHPASASQRAPTPKTTLGSTARRDEATATVHPEAKKPVSVSAVNADDWSSF